ncbi:MAG TPA: response regulator [Candidatus Methanoperedens sp.]
MSKKQILIVEDESIVAEDLKETLISLGYAVPSVESSGEKAIEKIEGMRPDLVLMDIMLQGAMDGIETAKEVHDRFDIPILYITSYSDEHILERAKITEPYCYIIKPFRERELHINIEIAIYKHQMENKLKESEHWLSSTIKSLGEAVISTDKNGLIKTMNPFAEAMTGWKFDEALAKPISTVFNIISEKPDIKVENPVTKAIREGIFYGLAEHTVLISKEGMEVPVDVIGSLIKDNFGNIMGTVMIFEDIIERKRLEERIKKTNIEQKSR